MTNEVQKAEGAQLVAKSNNPFEVLKDSLISQKGKFQMVLPSHITFEKFQSVIMTAAIVDPALLHAHRGSLMLSAIKAATDGLFPDGRDAAFVRFNSKIKDPETGQDRWVDRVQYMPMFQGILKKVRQSGQVSSIRVEVVYDKDLFKVLKGDDDRIVHEVYEGEDRGQLRAVYCITVLKDGAVQKEVMYRHEIEKVRKTSKSGAASAADVQYKKAKEIGEPKGIWKDWYEEMAKKTCFRRAAKWLPQSVDKGDAIRVFDNDDSMQLIENTIEHDPVEKLEGPNEEMKAIENDTSAQPDLKKAIDEKVEAKAEPEKQKAAAAKDKAKTASKAEEKQEPAKAEAQPEDAEIVEEKPKSAYDREMEVRDMLKRATNAVILQETLAVEYDEDLAFIKQHAAGSYKSLMDAVKARIQELGGGAE